MHLGFAWWLFGVSAGASVLGGMLGMASGISTLVLGIILFGFILGARPIPASRIKATAPSLSAYKPPNVHRAMVILPANPTF